MIENGPLRFAIQAEEAGSSLEMIVHKRLGVDAAEVLGRGGVWLDGRRVADVSLPAPLAGQIVIHRPPDGAYREVVVTDDDILYIDPWLLALNKRPGWYCGVVPWDLHGNALAAVGRYLQERDGVTPYLHMAHQLDRDTSGVLVFSRDPDANARLHAAFKDRTAQKRYLCLCAGTPPSGAFEVQTGHGRGQHGRFRVYTLDEVGTVLPGGGRVKLAYTRFTTLRQLDNAALVEAQPVSGRTHQIRLHLAHLGYPLLGDERYGGPTAYRGYTLGGHLLHAASLVLLHPITGATLTFTAPLPHTFRDLLQDTHTTKDERLD